MSELTIDLIKIGHNARLISSMAREQGIEIFGVGKGMRAPLEVAETLVRGGCSGLGDSRLENLQRIREGQPGVPLMLLRLPRISRASEIVAVADISLVSERATCEALSVAAGRIGKTHEVLLMVDLGDLREGVWPPDFMPFVREVSLFPSLRIYGVGTNLTCYGGVMPEKENLSQLVALARQASEYLGRELVVSGGNSSSLDLLFAREMPQGITNLRVGEGILLGREAIRRSPVPGAFTDTCVLSAEVIELKHKPSIPIGKVGIDAFGNIPKFLDRGVRLRAILSVGRQDVNVDGLIPRLPGAIVLGASGDHLMLDVHDCDAVSMGDILEFDVDYGAMLSASTSPYIRKVFLR